MIEKKLNRKKFIESKGATCSNWNWSWSFVNHEDKMVIFGAWEDLVENNEQEILDERWKFSRKGERPKGYNEAIKYLRLVEEEGYILKTFLMNRADRDESSIKEFSCELKTKFLRKEGTGWLALDKENQQPTKESPPIQCSYIEGKIKEKSGYVYERNAEARKKCIEEHGYRCAVCAFDFEKIYGGIGKEYIHVHHIIPLSERKKECEVDPIKDLIPVCPNCHAMIHRGNPALTVEQLNAHLKNASSSSGV